jgi:hypothetical protein
MNLQLFIFHDMKMGHGFLEEIRNKIWRKKTTNIPQLHSL